jgi:hypothetical protein
MAKLDISKLSPKEQKDLNKLLRKAGSSIAAVTGKSALSDPAYRQKCLKLRPKFEEMARKEGVTLAHIFTATEKPVKTYKHPETGQTYSGKGKKPDWLKGREEDYREGSKGTWPSLKAEPEPED